MKTLYTYTIFGLNIASEVECPEMRLFSGRPDVTIRYGLVPQYLGFSSYKGVCFEVLPGKFLLKAINVARYLVSNGNEIIVEPMPDAEEHYVRLFLLSSAMGALLLQRGTLSLHGNAVGLNNEAFIIAGAAGTGKSTLAAILISKGFELISDDIAVISYKNDMPFILPGVAQLKLWRDSLTKLDIHTEGLKRVRKELEKFFYLPETKFSNNEIFLKKIYILNSRNDDEISIYPISGSEKFKVLRNNTYRRSYVESMDMEKRYFELISRLASKTEISRLYRGKRGFKIEELANAVINDINRNK